MGSIPLFSTFGGVRAGVDIYPHFFPQKSCHLHFLRYIGSVYKYMAITRSAKKEIRASARRRVFNLRRLRTMRFLIKEVNTKHKEKDSEGVKMKYREAQKAIDKAAKRGVIAKRTASRRKSLLARTIKQGA